MKIFIIRLANIVVLSLFFISAYAQGTLAGREEIKSADLEKYILYLSSPLLQGRMNGSEGLNLATEFIKTEAQLTGLQPANNGSFFQPFSVIRKSYDNAKTSVSVSYKNDSSVLINKPFYQLVPMGVNEMAMEGEVVFAGYGIQSYKYHYDDFDSIETEGKILMIMNRAPMSEDGKSCLFTEPEWTTTDGLNLKLNNLLNLNAKAIIIVMDPKSGSSSLEDEDSVLSEYLATSIYQKGNEQQRILYPGMARVIFIHREVADELLNGSGYSLDDLQRLIDKSLKPHSFLIKDKRINFAAGVVEEEKILNNVAGIIEGRDRVLKKEVVIFSAHADHIGISGDGKIYPGADDDASGCAALLELAKAFSSLKKKPLRSVLFLWVSGEEIGLYGSEKYVNDPLFPLAKTVADINLDMLGRTKTIADTSDANPMTGPNSVFLITDDQSSDLNRIASDVDENSILDYDYMLSDKNNPLNIFERSDQYNFVLNDIPILLFTSGLHTTYHTTDDTIDKIDFRKLEMVTKDIFQIGYTVANRRKRIVVNNPFSSW